LEVFNGRDETASLCANILRLRCSVRTGVEKELFLPAPHRRPLASPVANA